MRYQVTYKKREMGIIKTKVTIIDGPRLNANESNMKEVIREIDEIMFTTYGRDIKVLKMHPTH